MKNIFLLLLMSLMAFFTAIPLDSQAQINASETPDWIQRLKRKGLNEFNHSDLNSDLILQGKQFNPLTGEWEWVRTHIDSVYANVPEVDGDILSTKIRESNSLWLGDYEAYKTAAGITSDATAPHPIYTTKAFSIFSELGSLFMEGGYYSSTGLNKSTTMQIQTADYVGDGSHPNQFWFNNIKKVDGIRYYPNAGRSLWFRGRTTTPSSSAKDAYGFEFYHYGLGVHDFKVETTLGGQTTKEVVFEVDTFGHWSTESSIYTEPSNSYKLTMFKQENGKSRLVNSDIILYDESNDRTSLIKETYFMNSAIFDPANTGKTLTLNGNVTFSQLATVKLPIRNTAPSNPVDGQIVLHDSDGDGDSDHLVVYLNGQWIRMSQVAYTW